MRISRHGIGLCSFAACAAMLYIAAGAAGQAPPAPTSHSQVQVSPAQELQWKTYSYPADGFSASFPFEPEQFRKDIESASGSYELRSYMTEDDRVALYIGVCDYGTKSNGESQETLLHSAEQGALKNSNSRLVSEQAITLGIYHGLEFHAENDSTAISARLYIVGGTLYQTLVVTHQGHPYPEMTRFLNSFQLIARTAQ